MKKIREIWKRIVSLCSGRRQEREMQEEMQHHIDLEIERNLQSGMSEKEARSMALRKFGNVGGIQMDARENRTILWIEQAIRDLRFSLRKLRKSMGFSFTIIATLALCIGANAAILSVLNSFVLKPLPFRHSDQIVQVFQNFEGYPQLPDSRMSWNHYLDFKERDDLFEELALCKVSSAVVDDRLEYSITTTSSFFDVMGVRPLLGRFFTPEEVYPGPGNVAMLTQSEWERNYASDPEIVGKEVKSSTTASPTIIGVAPKSMEVFHSKISFFKPIAVASWQLGAQSRSDNFDMWARLKSGVSHTLIADEMSSMEERWYDEVADAGMRANHESYPSSFQIGRPSPFSAALLMLQGGAFVLLVVGSMNILNLMTVRATGRSQELFVRHSLGAGRFTVAKMMLSESLLLSLLGVLMGYALALAGLHVINGTLAVLLPNRLPIALDGMIFFWMLIVAGIIALMMTLLPAWLLRKSDCLQHVESNARTSSTGGVARKWSGSMVVFQFALSFTLLVGAGLLFRSLQNVVNVDPGFDVSHLVRGTIILHPRDYSGTQVIETRGRILQSIRGIPGVEGVSFLMNEKLVGEDQNLVKFLTRGGPVTEYQDATQVIIQGVGEDFFSTMGIPIVEGRSFRPEDDEAGSVSGVVQTSIIVDEAFSSRYLKDQGTAGSELHLEFLTDTSGRQHYMPVVGVAKRANFQGLDARDGTPVVYVSRESGSANRFTVIARTTRPSAGVIREMRAKLREIDSSLYMSDAAALGEQMENLHLDRRGIALLANVFAILALLLSATGVYGVLAYDVQQRQREFGVRLALGAARGDVLKMVLKQGLWKAGLGLALGMIGALALTRYLSSLLFDVTSLDLVTYVVAMVVLLFIASLSSFIPARRATRIDPMIALRAE